MDNNNNGLSYNNLEEDLSVVFKKIRFLNLKLNTSQNENAKLKTRLIELEHELSNERTKNAEVLLELKTSKELINKLDKNEYSKCSNDAKQESQLQLLTNKLNSMSDKLKHSQNENSQLKQNEQKLLSELEQLKSAQDIFNAKYSYALTTFDKLNNRYKDLESKQHSLLSVYEMSCSVGDSMSLRLKHHHSALKSCKEKNEEILDKLILQEDELTKLKTTSNVVTSNDKLTVIDDVKFVTDCQECMKDVKNEISKIMDYNKELNDLLQETLEKHFTFQENEIKLKEKIKDMEKQLQLQKTTEN